MSYSIITHAEEEGSRDEQVGLESISCKVTLRTAYAQRYNLVSDLLLNQRVWPHFDPAVAPRARSCSIINTGLSGPTAGSMMTYDESLVSVNYSHEQKDLAVEELEPTIEFRTLDHRLFRWASNDDILLEPEAPGRLLQKMNFVKTFYFVTAIPAAVFTAVGHVNSGSHTSTFFGATFLPETLLYQPPNISRSITIGGGADLFTVKIKFSYNPFGWNKFWRAKTQAYDEMKHYESGLVYKNFPLTSFTTLFTMPQVA